MERIADHADRAVARLPSALKSSETIVDLVSLAAGQVQELEDAIFDLLAIASIDASEGAQLDTLGRILGQARGDMSDESFRVWLKTRQRVNRSSGTTPELLAIVRAVVPAATVVRAIEGYPAGIAIRVEGTPVDIPGDVAALVRAAGAGGVRVVFEYSRHAPAATFRFGSGPGFGVGKFAGAKV